MTIPPVKPRHSSSLDRSSITTAFQTLPVHSTETSRSFELELRSRKEKRSSSATSQSVKITMPGRSTSDPSSRKESVLVKFVSSIVSMDQRRSLSVTRFSRRSSFLIVKRNSQECPFKSRSPPGSDNNFFPSLPDSNRPTLPPEVPFVPSFPTFTTSLPIAAFPFQFIFVKLQLTIVSKLSNPQEPSSRRREPRSRLSPLPS